MIDIINYGRWLSYRAMSYQAREQARERYLFWRANILDTLGASEAQVEGIPDEVLGAVAQFVANERATKALGNMAIRRQRAKSRKRLFGLAYLLAIIAGFWVGLTPEPWRIGFVLPVISAMVVALYAGWAYCPKNPLDDLTKK